MAIIAAITNGGKRRPFDFYPTPSAATHALLPLINDWPREVWEPCAGAGAIAQVLEAADFHVLASDLLDHGYGLVGCDFFKQHTAWCDSVVSNPPFAHADEFILHASRIGVQRMALLLKMDFWSAAKRLRVWEKWRPSGIYPLTWRLDFTGAGSPHTNVMWCLWNGKDTVTTTVDLLLRPQRR